MKRYLNWTQTSVPWYRFWDLRSGAPGGIIMATLLVLIITILWRILLAILHLV